MMSVTTAMVMLGMVRSDHDFDSGEPSSYAPDSADEVGRTDSAKNCHEVSSSETP